MGGGPGTHNERSTAASHGDPASVPLPSGCRRGPWESLVVLFGKGDAESQWSEGDPRSQHQQPL